ncbi:L-serine ammonia-lyase [Sphingopyxis kveilinensis]|uniref:L-serine ammonia-lyase n=1 Tax=Sphingopyxis kveilinensis TaxID=3114367 RepID=UPI0030D2E68B
MTFSLFDMFKIGIGPSSSHTMGPMTACSQFVAECEAAGMLARAGRASVELFGSLALTGIGHGTDWAVIAGLSGERPDTAEPDEIAHIVADARTGGVLTLGGKREVAFVEARDIRFLRRERMPFHTNAMRCSLFDQGGSVLATSVYYSVGGGAIVKDTDQNYTAARTIGRPLRFPFSSGAELLQTAERERLSIAELMWANETALRPEAEVQSHIKRVLETMSACIARGLEGTGELPGGLRVRRRAHALHHHLLSRESDDPLVALDWINLWALAVNEENAGGGRVVTAPTNGAAGIIPAVLQYYRQFHSSADLGGEATFLLTATAIGSLFKENASISGAEVGCQGEVGVACSMAAGGLTAALGGSNSQIENAAEIAMEHNLGLTCDPVGGLVQVPCIERNAVGAVKAIEASRLALSGDGSHRVSLDQVIDAMRRTGADMLEKYKETSLGGLAVIC